MIYDESYWKAEAFRYKKRASRLRKRIVALKKEIQTLQEQKNNETNGTKIS